MSVGQIIRNFKRLNQIADLLANQEMGYFLEKLNLQKYLALRRKKKIGKFIPKDKGSMPERLRLVMEELGGTFVKLGQLLSLRQDLLPPEYCDEFAKLQDEVKPFSYLAAKKIIESELGKSLRSVFKEFNQKPIAAASVGQVHKAILKDGRVVAVKVQRPNIERIFDTDIQLMYHLAALIEKHLPETRDYDPIGIVEEFENYTRKELDYMLEAKNIDVFYQNFKLDPNVKVPKVNWDFTTSKVIVMEFIDGQKISHIKNYNKYHSQKKKVAEVVANSFFKQVLEHGVFHADPHPGNIFLIKNNKIALLDFGIIGKLTPEDMERIQELFIALLEPNVDGIVRSFVEYGFIDEDKVDLRKFRADVLITLGDYYGSSLKQIDMVGFSHDIYKIARQYKIKFPPNFVLLLKAIATVEGFGRQLDPDFNLTEFAKPTVDKLIRKKMEPKNLLRGMKKSLDDTKYFLKKLPKDISSGLKSFRTGLKVNVDLDNVDIRRFTIEMDRSSNRIAMSMLIAALIVGASLLIHSGTGPQLWGYPLLATLCLIFAGILFLFLAFSIFREKKPKFYDTERR